MSINKGMIVKGDKWSPEMKEKLSLIAKKKGFGKWMAGKKHSESTKEKMSKGRKGKPHVIAKRKPHSEETKRKIGLANKGKKRTNEQKKLLSEIHLNKPNRYWLGKVGHKPSLETRKKMSATGKNNREKHWSWKGGIYPENRKIRLSFEYRIWRKSVFERDNYTCQHCGVYGGELNADHIKPFSDYPELRFDLSNGRTLCVPCHKKTPTYGGKRKKQIHDELVIEVPKDKAEELMPLVKSEMENALKLPGVPIVTEPHISDKWTK